MLSSVLEETLLPREQWARGPATLPQGFPVEILHLWAREEMCSPMLAWWQEGKFSSDLGPWKLTVRFLFPASPPTPHGLSVV